MKKLFFYNNQRSLLRFAFLTVILLQAIAGYAQNISTIAGGGIPGNSYTDGNGGPATGVYFFGLDAVAVDNMDNVYVGDWYTSLVWKINNATGIISIVAGGGSGSENGPATDAAINIIYGLCLDKKNNLYIVDAGNNVILKVDTSGDMTVIAGNGNAGYSGDSSAATDAELNLPDGVAVDTAGNVYIADSYNNSIRKVDTSGSITTVVGNGTPGYTGDNGPATAALISNPFGVATDLNNNLYIADANEVVRKVNAAGIISTVAGNGNMGYTGDGNLATNATMNNPEAVMVNSAGNMYITDMGNNVIRMVNTAGIISTVAGNGIAGYTGNGGPAASAELNGPFDAVADGLGNIFIADGNNSVVREVAYTCTRAVAGSVYSSIGDTVVCSANSDLLTLAGTTPYANGLSYQWQFSADGVSWSNTGSDTAFFITGEDSVTTYFRTIVSCSTYNTADTATTDTLIVLHNVTPTVSVSASPLGALCAGTTVIFNTATTYGGPNPAFQWMKNGTDISGAVNSEYSSAALDSGDVITCLLTSDNTCAATDTATSNSATVSFIPIVTPVVSISADPGTTVCAGATITFTAATTNGGATPAYQWMENDINIPGATGNTFSSNSLDSEDMIACTMTTSLSTCVLIPIVTSNTDTVWIGSVIPEISITASPDTDIAPGQTVTFTANAVNGGNAPAYQWQENGTNIPGATAASYVSDTLSDGSVITCVLTSNSPCLDANNVSSNSVVIHISSGIASVANNGSNIRIYPNPNNGVFSVTGNVAGDDREIQVTVLNMIGQVIYQATIPVQNGAVNGQIGLTDKNADGFYFLRIKTSNGSSTIRFVVER